MATLIRALALVAILVGGAGLPVRAQADEIARARAGLEAGRFQETYDLLKPAFDRGDRDPERLRLLGRAAMGLGQPAEAVDFFAPVAEGAAAAAGDHANLAWARYEQAVSLGGGGLARAAFLDAAAAARQAVQLDRGSLTGWRFLGAALDGAGDPEDAEKAYREGIDALGAGGRPLRLALATSLAARGDTEAALAALVPLGADAAQDPELTLARASIWAGAGRLDRAAELLDALLEAKPDQPEAYRAIWSLFGAPENRARGIAVLESVLARHPRNLEAQGYLGNFQLVEKNYEAAERAYRKCIEIRPDYAWAHRALGELFRQKADQDLASGTGDRAAARKDLGLAIDAFLAYLDCASAQGSVDPAVPPIIDVLIYNLAREGLDPDPQAAYVAFKRFLAHYPENTAFHHTLGLIAQDLGRFDEAEAAIRTSIAGCPPDDPALLAAYLVNLGLLYEAWNKYPQATDQYQLAAKLTGKGKLDALDNLGKLAYKLGNPKKALGYFKAVIDEEPTRYESLFYYHYCRRWLERESYFRRP